VPASGAGSGVLRIFPQDAVAEPGFEVTELPVHLTDLIQGEQFTDRELLIPASRARDRMTLSLEDVSFTDVTQQLGLVVGGPAQQPPTAEAD
jgi:hypothetical protein